MLTYRFGFLCHHADDRPESGARASLRRAAWSSRSCEDFVIRLHPETRIEIHRRAEGAVVVIGDAYSQSEASLADLLVAVPWEDPWPALDLVGGRYAVLFLSGGRMRVAHDAFGARSLFYRPGHNAAASHARLLARAYGLAPSRTAAGLMERPEYGARTVKYLPGDLTAFEDVFALTPNNFWDGDKTHRYWPRRPRTETTAAEFLAEVETLFRYFVPFILSRYVPVFGITGGIDSRAAFAPFGRKFLGVTWTHYFPRSERPVVERLIEHLALDHTFVSRSHYEAGNFFRAAGRNNGGLRPGDCLYEGMAAKFSTPGNVFIRGYGGEILRGFPAYQDLIPSLSARDMTIAYGSSIRKVAPTEEYQTSCEEVFAAFRVRANYAGLEAYRHKPMDHFYWEHRMGMWGASMLNEMDGAVYSTVGLNSRPLYEAAFGLPDEVRLTKALLTSVVALYDERLAAIPHT